MGIDSIVDEVRAAREAYGARFNFDLNAIHQDLKELERASGRKVVRLSPKRLDGESPEPTRTEDAALDPLSR